MGEQQDNLISVRLPDGKEMRVEAGTTPATIAERIGSRLARAALAAKVNGEVVDLSRPIDGDADLAIITPSCDDPDSLYILRHSCAHVMAEAICDLFPETKLVYGPPVDNGFYYDIDLDRPLTPEDFDAITGRMGEIVKADRPFTRYDLPRAEAMAKLRAEGNPYKIDNAEAAQGDTLSFYVTGGRAGGGWEDLCRGPHLPRTGRIRAFKVMSIAGAYYRGDARGKQLQRLYGTAFHDKKELNQYLHQLEEAKKRDHRTLGRQLELFSVQDDVGAGLIHWHPKGGLIRHLVESFWKNEHLARGYDLVYTPHIASERIYQISGHLEKYAEMMYSPMDIDGTDYYLKPMNCPGHYKIYQSGSRSYRDLPIRYAELGTVYRYEPSGTLHGMLRVRGFTQDDAHTFCTRDQLAAELDLVLELMDFMMRSFGYTYKAYLATRPEQYLGTEEEWAWTTDELRQALVRRDLPFEIDEGGGVFYAPKIDIKLIDSLGREWQGPTHQVDLQAAKRFGLDYVGADNASHEPIVIHRTVLGSMERFIGGLIEHFAGAFPVWLAPIQARVLTISEKFNDYAREVTGELRKAGIRAEMDLSSDKIGAKVRRAATADKVFYMLIVGEQEVAEQKVSVRHRTRGQQGMFRIPQIIAGMRDEIEGRVCEV